MESIRIRIKGPFDLGYIVEDESGQLGQLRVLEMKPERLEIHKQGREKELVGLELDVFVMYRYDKGYRVSELPPEKLRQRTQRAEAMRKGWLQVVLGQELEVVVQHVCSWGLICEGILGKLPVEGSIPTRETAWKSGAWTEESRFPETTESFQQGDALRVVVVTKSSEQRPLVFDLA